jgi:hypothetical protein
MMVATAAASSGCQVMLVEVNTTTTTEVDAGTTMIGDDEVHGNPGAIPGTVPRSRATHHHHRHRHLHHHHHHRTDIHDECMIADNPSTLAAGAWLSLILYEMSGGLRSFYREQ